jgi:tRNA1Val (adenine37-N6)-methyltransferase
LEPFGKDKLFIFQKKQGYRFSLDSVLLAGLTTLRHGNRVIDLGTGCGIVSLLLACRFPDCTLVGVESQSSLASLAARNVLVNGLTGRVEILAGEMQNLHRHFPSESFDVVVSNPPYRPLGSGRVNPLTERAIARHELHGSLEAVALTTNYLLPPGGRLALIYPAWRLIHLCSSLRSNSLEPKTLRFIHSRTEEEAKLVWVEARKGGREDVKVLPPLIIYQSQGRYTEEMEKIFSL